MTEKELLKHKMEMIDSLREAIKEAGGRNFSFSELYEMTMEDLLDSFTQNGIRFYFDKPYKIPSRLEGLDYVIKEHMLDPKCTIFS